MAETVFCEGKAYRRVWDGLKSIESCRKCCFLNDMERCTNSIPGTRDDCTLRQFHWEQTEIKKGDRNNG